jgi:4-hydroxybenzoate polyprenyltransferase
MGKIRESIKVMFQAIRKLILVSRPISWLNTAYPFAAGYLLSGGKINTLFIVGSIYFLIPYNLLMYGVNDVYDYDSDILNPRKGGIEGMREQRKFHPLILRAAFIANVPFIAYFVIVGNFASVAILAIVLFFVIAYSITKLRFKEKPLLDSVTSSIHFVGPLIYGLTLNGFSSNVGPYLLAFFLWGMASHAFGAVQDIIPDRKGKIKSIATIFGARWTVRFSVVLYLIASILMIEQGFPAVVVGLVGLLYAVNCIRYWSVSDIHSNTTNKAWKRFIWLNLFTGFIITLVLITTYL